MTKIHPEAVALLNKHCGMTRGLNGMIHNGPATEAISQALFERDALKGEAAAIYNRLMPEVETLRAQVARLERELSFYKQRDASILKGVRDHLGIKDNSND